MSWIQPRCPAATRSAARRSQHECAAGKSLVEEREIDRDVMAERGQQCACVEELVVPERLRPRIWAAQGVEHRTDRVEDTADQHEDQRGRPTMPGDVR